ncbi:MAG TPA: hypothetical protein VIY29_28105 [Ktedonobacteraceae bacterium]
MEASEEGRYIGGGRDKSAPTEGWSRVVQAIIGPDGGLESGGTGHNRPRRVTGVVCYRS